MNGYDIAGLYYLLDDDAQATLAFQRQGTSGIDLPEWEEISAAVYATYPDCWQNLIHHSIGKHKQYLQHIETGEWEFDSPAERDHRRREIEAAVLHRNLLLQTGPTRPPKDPRRPLLSETCGCLLFGCRKHHHPEDDSPPQQP